MAHLHAAPLRPRGQRGARNITRYYAEVQQLLGIDLATTASANVTHYYTHDHAAYWFGDGLTTLGLEAGAGVVPKHFERLLLQRDPHFGNKLPNNGGRRAEIAMWDLTLSMNKELSILMMLGDEVFVAKMMDIFTHANTEMLEYVEEHVSKVRRGAGGLVTRATPGLIGATTTHTSARPVDGVTAPSFHFHNSIMALGFADGVYTALDATDLLNYQKPAQALATQIIEQETAKEFGFRWVPDKSGLRRLVGVGELERELLSLRQREIMERALSDGIDLSDREQIARIQQITRADKAAHCGNDAALFDRAKEILTEVGFNMDTFWERKEQLDRAYDQTIQDRQFIAANFPAPPEDRYQEMDWRLDVAKALSVRASGGGPSREGVEAYTSTFREIDWDRFNRAMAVDARDPEVIREASAREALFSVGRSQSTWRKKDLEAALFHAGFSRSEAAVRVDTFLASEDVVHITGTGDSLRSVLRVSWSDQPVYVLTELLEMERRLVREAQQGVGVHEARLTEEQFASVLTMMGERGKNVEDGSDQHEMLRALFFDGHTIATIAGQAGSGKSAGAEAYSIVLEAGYLAERAGYLGAYVTEEDGGDVVRHQIVGCALAAAAAENLERSAELPSYSITMLLARLESGAILLGEGGVVLVDEGSQASTAQLCKLLDYVIAAGGQLVIMGDPRQLSSVDSGGMYKTLIDKVPEAVVFLDETRRQNNLEERAILALLHDRGRLRKASLAALEKQGVGAVMDLGTLDVADEEEAAEVIADFYIRNGRVRFFASNEETATAIGERYWNVVQDAGGDPKAALVLAKSNAEVKGLDRAIVREAVSRGHLKKGDVVEFGGRSFYIGQRVISRKVDRIADILNGYYGEVLGVDTITTAMSVELASPSPYTTQRTLRGEIKEGDVVMVKMSPKKVAAERANAARDVERRAEHVLSGQERRTRATATIARNAGVVDKARTRLARASTPATVEAAHMAIRAALEQGKKAKGALTEAEMKLAYSEAKYDTAISWDAWAQGLPNDGGDVAMTVASAVIKSREERLIVRLEDDTTRALTERFVDHHIEGGHAVTDQRGQGQTVKAGIVYQEPTYTAMSRGEEINELFRVVSKPDPAFAETARQNLLATSTFLADRTVAGGPGVDYLTTQNHR